MTGFFAAWQRGRMTAAKDENAAVAQHGAWPGPEGADSVEKLRLDR